MIWKVEVFPKEVKSSFDIVDQLRNLGVENETEIFFKKVYLIDSSSINEQNVDLIVNKLLIDPLVDDFIISKGFFSKKPKENEITIINNPGVFDAVAASLHRAIGDLSLKAESVNTARFYRFHGLDRNKIVEIAPKILFNPLIEHIVNYDKVKNIKTLSEFMNVNYDFKLIKVDVLTASDQELERISKEGSLSLTLQEMQTVKNYFRSLKRNPTDCELETIAQTWSEHCAHKTFGGIIHYQEKDEKGKILKEEIIDHLLKSTVMKATKDINSQDCVSVFFDNSGVVKFDDDYNICFKVETHNHPSSLEPYGGASTGIGGVIRDILGTGCCAKPVANTDIFCFADWKRPHSEVPQSLLHPKRIIQGVVRGVRDYGNRMGIPTISGAVFFDERFLGNPLVYCGTVGIMPKEKSFNEVFVGDCIIVCGARTGRDGIHGATFSSVELTEDTVELTSAVQIGNPIEEKKLMEAIVRARDLDLFTAVTDCGAGGLSSAVGEMAKKFGADVWLEKVPLKYSGLSYTETWISESQERMVIFTQDDKLDQLKDIFDEEEVEMAVIGKVKNDKKLTLFYEGNKVCDLDMDFLHDTIPLEKKATWIEKESVDIKIKDKKDYTRDLQKLLAMPNIAPKDWIVHQYDHEVQGHSVVKPIIGKTNLQLSDASVIRPDIKSKKAIALGCGINPWYSDIDPYAMAELAIDEALRNIACVGGRLDKTYILDNFSWGSPNDEKLLAGLVRASKACYDLAVYYGTPFISGKDSLYNEYVVADQRIAIPSTLLISAMSVLDDYSLVVPNAFNKNETLIYILGNTFSHMGASHYFKMCEIDGGNVPRVDKGNAKNIFAALNKAITKKLVASVHDCSEGGAAVTIAEMCLGKMRGANIFLTEFNCGQDLLDYEVLFSESPTRFVVEVEKSNKDSFENVMKDVPYGLIGCVSEDTRLVFFAKDKNKLIDADLLSLQKSWMDTFNTFRYKER